MSYCRWMLPKHVYENVVFYSVSSESSFCWCVGFALLKSFCSKTTYFTRSRFLSARLAAGWTLWIWRKHAYLRWISRPVAEAEKAAASWKQKNNTRHSRKLIWRSSGRRRQGRQKGRWSRRMNAETSRRMTTQKSKKEKTQTDEEEADGHTANRRMKKTNENDEEDAAE